jgi:acyl-CoA dehydrogenase
MSDIARMLDETAERLLSRHFATAERGSEASAAALLAETKEAGLDLVLAPEAAGGLDAGTLEASAIAYRWGYHAAPGAIVDLMLLNGLSGVAGLETMSGSTIVLGEGIHVGPGWVRPETAHIVSAPVIGGETSRLLVCAPGGEGTLVVAAFDATGAERRKSMAGEDIVLLDLAAAEPMAVHATGRDFEAFSARAALLTSSAILGATQRLLEIAIEHANTRKQFGKPLGKFQAIQNMLAEAASEHVVAQAAARAAIAAQDAGALRPLQWQSAKIQCGRAATTVAAAAHQILGAIGFTEEHVLHHYSKRLWGWRDDWGRQAGLEKQVGEAACAHAGGLWPWMVD